LKNLNHNYFIQVDDGTANEGPEREFRIKFEEKLQKIDTKDDKDDTIPIATIVLNGGKVHMNHLIKLLSSNIPGLLIDVNIILKSA
jgi:hypothetical protein